MFLFLQMCTGTMESKPPITHHCDTHTHTHLDDSEVTLFSNSPISSCLDLNTSCSKQGGSVPVPRCCEETFFTNLLYLLVVKSGSSLPPLYLVAILTYFVRERQNKLRHHISNISLYHISLCYYSSLCTEWHIFKNLKLLLSL